MLKIFPNLVASMILYEQPGACELHFNWREGEQQWVMGFCLLITQGEGFYTKNGVLWLGLHLLSRLQDKNIPVTARSCSSSHTLIIWAVV